MSNYSVTGALKVAANELFHAANAMPSHTTVFAEDKLHARIVRLMHQVESCEKAAKKLIPGGWKPARNMHEEDKREQLAAQRGEVQP